MTDELSGNLAARILVNAPEAIVYADRGGTIHMWNAGAERMFGWAPAEAIGETLEIIIPEKLRERHWEGYRAAIESGTSRYGADDLLAVPGIKRDGTRVSLEFSIVLIRDDDDAVAGIAAIIRDVTERRQKERDLQDELRALREKA